MTKHEGKYTGWGIGNRPFSETEFKHSHIGGKKASYSRYLKSYADVVVKKRKKTQHKKATKKSRSSHSMFGSMF